jgi:hypothetical protein
MTEEQKQALANDLTAYIGQPLNNPMTRSQWMEIAKIALDALTAQPDDWKQRAEGAEAIVSDVNEIIGLLSEREWAEHCTKTETGKLLEELITELHDDASPASGLTELVPDEIPGAFVYHGAKGAFDAGKSAGWNACRDEVLKNIEERESEKA